MLKQYVVQSCSLQVFAIWASILIGSLAKPIGDKE